MKGGEKTMAEILKREGKNVSNAQFDSYLETLAKLIESSAKTPEEAAQIVRSAKTSNQNKQ